ncbi:MAG: lytic murein transglycosylase [Silicimonas sp.]|nr:lytic murein transglycosylase [Silicimonas sp.]
MEITRRRFSAGVAALGLAGCSGPGALTSAETGSAASLSADLRPASNAGYDAWVAGFRKRAQGQGFSSGLIDRAFAGTGYLPGVVTRDRNQIERKRSLEDYLSIAASDERVSKGRAAFARHRGTLKAIESAYGVDSHIVAAIWGLESFYGERRGSIPVVSATSTLAYDGRRGRFFERQLLAALRILRDGQTTPSGLVGSWAGAMGHTQFIPTSYLEYAVDFTGDGRSDIWSDNPADALASTARYLSRNGWRRGLRWGGEAGSGSGDGNIIRPQPGGPGFVTTANFRVIKRYNNSDSYAIGIGHLADRIVGGPPLRGKFPPDGNGMTKDDRVQLQRRLTAKGFDTGGTDGVIGPKTRDAIRAYQTREGLPVTGEPSLALLGI